MTELTSTQVTGLAARVGAVVECADHGDERAERTVRALVNEFPEVWDAYANLALVAETALIDLLAGSSVLTREALRKKLRDMRAELAGPAPSPLEKLLAERVAACWLHSYQADLAYAKAVGQLPPQAVELYQRRQDRAARQYLKAIRSLAGVRRLLVPALQVNIADRQVNIAGGAGAPATAPRRVRHPRDGRRRAGLADGGRGAPGDPA